jgi:hypothetical protein
MGMPRLSRLPLLAAAAGALAVPAGASAATQPADCHLQAPRAAVEHAIPGTDLVARDPYGGLLSRTRLFFDFSVRGDAQALAGVAKVQWALDGTVVREDPTPAFVWKGVSGSSRMPAGDHTITVTVTPKSGAPASTQFALTATDCQNATFVPEIQAKRGQSLFTWDSAFESTDGEPLTGVSLTAPKNVAVALPSSLRGRAIGTLQVKGKTYTLKGGRTALAKGALKVTYVPGATTFFKVTGLPAGTQGVSVRLKPGLLQLRSPKRAYRITGRLTAASGSVGLEGGGRYF